MLVEFNFTVLALLTISHCCGPLARFVSEFNFAEFTEFTTRGARIS